MRDRYGTNLEVVIMHPNTVDSITPSTRHDLAFVWLEITGKCQLACTHCYADSGPDGTHGPMRRDDWLGVIDQVADLGAGMVQFIGGEPTLNPDLPALIEHATARGLEVEVFSNLVHVSDQLWSSFGREGVRLACSYYSDRSSQHARVTGRNTHARTKNNIAEALRREIPLRVGIVNLTDDQRTNQAHEELAALGVTDIGHDHLRGVGRGVSNGKAGIDQLCGNCTNDVLAISATGEMWPCVFSRWLAVGNVLEAPLGDILTGRDYARVRNELDAHFEARGSHQAPCVPNMCNPQCGPSCSPACRPTANCRPVGTCAPSYRP
ncbi:radical SAM protein [Natronoglycomyces albus]|uniref:Radical SAM protein n=1 Tax=Natronoglycomyces albus TaxID=2811108 RepID=A0A895XNC0_9ACTN|nr:radical SAM protein [Natronoglycomyces albus]QSB04889.1 radical SAM protein [Natronoglycomyces albus]